MPSLRRWSLRTWKGPGSVWLAASRPTGQSSKPSTWRVASLTSSSPTSMASVSARSKGAARLAIGLPGVGRLSLRCRQNYPPPSFAPQSSMQQTKPSWVAMRSFGALQPSPAAVCTVSQRGARMASSCATPPDSKKKLAPWSPRSAKPSTPLARPSASRSWTLLQPSRSLRGITGSSLTGRAA